MSRGPAQIAGEDDAGDYAAAFRAANRMSNEGKSWSGNERNCVYLNTGKTRFADVSAIAGLDFSDDARAVALTDWDHDGDLDLIQTNRTAPQLRLLRNDWRNNHSWVAFRLVGTRCNRDAVGARVRLYRKDVKGYDTRTLYAGCAFLSQSSKSIHFGLGTSDQITNVEVLWPDGELESFGPVEARQRYRLVQGTGEAQTINPRDAQRKLSPGESDTPRDAGHARVVLAARAPLPILRYRTFSGQDVLLQYQRPTLIQLWASWCPMCQAELSDFSEQAAQLQAAGIDVTSLCVNGVGEDDSTPEEAQELIARLRFPFSVGSATEELLAKMELLRGELFGNSRSFPIPTSFLVDAQGRLVVVYLGPVGTERVIADAGVLDASEDHLRELSSPFRGRWFTQPRPILLAPLASAFREAGFSEDAQAYQRQAVPQMALSQCALALDRERQGDMPGALAHYQTALKMAPRSARVHNLVGKHFLRRRDMNNARKCFGNALTVDPSLADAHFNLATVAFLEGKLDEAKSQYQDAIRDDARRADAHVALGRLLQREGDQTAAEAHLLTAIRVDPTFAPAHVYLGVLYTNRDQLERAVASFNKAIQSQPDLVDAHAGLARIFALRGESRQAAQQYRRVLQADPKSSIAAMNLAWFIATDPEGKIGTREEAIALARRVAQATRFRSWQSLDILAAAYANAAQYEKASSVARQALKLVENDANISAAIQERIALYDNKQPFRSP